MSSKELLLITITMICSLLLGPALAHYAGMEFMTFFGVDLYAQPSSLEFIFLIVLLSLWYPLWCFLGLIIGIVIARPLCGAGAISALGIASSVNIPIFTPIYNYASSRLYREKNTTSDCN